MVEQTMLPQSFAMIGGDDHQRPIELAAAVQFLEQLAQVLVQISKTTVIGVSNQGSIVQGQFCLFDRCPTVQSSLASAMVAASNQSGARLLGDTYDACASK